MLEEKLFLPLGYTREDVAWNSLQVWAAERCNETAQKRGDVVKCEGAVSVVEVQIRSKPCVRFEELGSGPTKVMITKQAAAGRVVREALVHDV